MLDEIIQWLEQFEDVIEVAILENNKYLLNKKVYLKDDFVRFLSEYDFTLDGIGSKEFHITIDTELTFQVHNFTYATELVFE